MWKDLEMLAGVALAVLFVVGRLFRPLRISEKSLALNLGLLLVIGLLGFVLAHWWP
jgi:hypothetical protein